MAANIESMFYVREKPWHRLGVAVKKTPTSSDALVYAGLDWIVEQKDVYTQDSKLSSGYKANTRNTDGSILGIVSDRYKVVQNEDAFRFTDDLLGEGVTYETVGSLQGGRKVWMLAKMPLRYIIAGDEIAPYMVVMNSHDGSSGIKVAMTPIRVVCSNTLNLALNSAKRIWATKHTENVMNRVHEARETLFLAETYMSELGRGIEDLSHVGKNGYRFVNAVSDFATHADPIRKAKNYNENLFLKTVEGNPLIDKAYKMAQAIA